MIRPSTPGVSSTKRKGGLGHGLAARLGRSPQPFDRSEGFLVQIGGAGLRRLRPGGCRAGAPAPNRYLPVSKPPASGLKAV